LTIEAPYPYFVLICVGDIAENALSDTDSVHSSSTSLELSFGIQSGAYASKKV
jgi:hypothetical protein